MAVKILWVILSIVYPFKYKHEAKELYEFITDGGKLK